MADRHPLVNIAGEIQELPSADQIDINDLPLVGTKVSALPAASAAAAANEFGINESGTSKKLTVRQVEEFVHDKGANVASAATVTLGDGHYFHITGTTTITDIDFTNSWDGRNAILVFDGILTLTHNATTLILPGGLNIVTAAGDACEIVIDSGDNVKVLWYQRATSQPIGQPRVRALASNHAISSTTGTEVTGLGPMTLEPGTYTYQFSLIVQAAAATTQGIGLGINFTGTAATRTIHMRYPATGTTNNTGVMDDVGGGASSTGQLLEWNGTLTFSTTSPNMINTPGFATGSANVYVVIEGILVVTASGDLELWHSSETAASTTVVAGSSLVVIRTA
jgi:hypothetical protein